MNVTLSIDDALVARARSVAEGRGKSLNQLIRELLEAETGTHDGESTLAALEDLWAGSPGHSGGESISREDAHGKRSE